MILNTGSRTDIPAYYSDWFYHRIEAGYVLVRPPYGADIEPHVPPKEQVIASFRQLSAAMGSSRISWRYDPVFITDTYSVSCHIEQFHQMAEALSGYTSQCVVVKIKALSRKMWTRLLILLCQLR